MKFIGTIVFLMLTSFGFGQLSWMHSYGGQGYDEGHAAVQLEDSSYVVTGSTSSFYNSNQNILFLRVDSLGTFLQSNFIDNGGYDIGNKIIQLQNHEYWISGYTNSIGAGGFDGYLAKVDSLGNKIEDFTFGGNEWDFFYEMYMLSDSSLILAGETQSFGAGNKDGYIVKVDKNGNTLWSKTIGFSENDWLKSVIEFNDTLYFVGGSEDEDSDTTFGLFVSYTTNGDSVFTKRIAYSENQEFNDIVWFYPWGQMYLLGRSYNVNNYDQWFYMLDAQANYLDNNIYGDADGDDNLKCGAVYPNSTNLYNVTEVSGSSYTFPDGHDALVFKSNPGGWFNTGQFYGHFGNDDGNDVISTLDGGALIIGTTRNFDYGFSTGGSSVMLIKIGVQDSFPTNDPSPLSPITNSLNEYEIQSLEFFPNPTSDQIYVQLDQLGKEQFTYTLVQLNGQVIEQNNLTTNHLDLSHLDSGMYFLWITGKTQKYMAKIIKQ